MHLEIENPEGLELDAFAAWLCQQIINSVKDPGTHDQSLEKLWDDYFQENDLGWARDETGQPIPPSTAFIIKSYFDNLVATHDGNNINITVDSAVRIRRTNLTVEALAALINYGTLLVPPYPHFDSVFDAFAANLQDYYDTWRASSEDSSNSGSEEQQQSESEGSSENSEEEG